MKLITGMMRSGTSWLAKSSMSSSRGYGEHTKQEPGVLYWLSEPTELGRGLRYWTLDQTREYICGLQRTFPHTGEKEPILKHHFIVQWLPEIMDLFSSVCVCLREPDSWYESASRHDATRSHIRWSHPWFEPGVKDTPEQDLRRFGQNLYDFTRAQLERLTSQGYSYKLTVFDFNKSDPEKTLEKFLSIPWDEARSFAKDFEGSRWKKK